MMAATMARGEAAVAIVLSDGKAMGLRRLRAGAPRPGGPRTIRDEEVAATIRLTLETMALVPHLLSRP